MKKGREKKKEKKTTISGAAAADSRARAKNQASKRKRVKFFQVLSCLGEEDCRAGQLW